MWGRYAGKPRLGIGRPIANGRRLPGDLPVEKPGRCSATRSPVAPSDENAGEQKTVGNTHTKEPCPRSPLQQLETLVTRTQTEKLVRIEAAILADTSRRYSTCAAPFIYRTFSGGLRPRTIAAGKKYRNTGMPMRKITVLMTANRAPAIPPLPGIFDMLICGFGAPSFIFAPPD